MNSVTLNILKILKIFFILKNKNFENNFCTNINLIWNKTFGEIVIAEADNFNNLIFVNYVAL